MRIKKKIVLLLCISIGLLALTACGQDPKKVDYNGQSYEDLENAAVQSWYSIQSWDVSSIQEMIAQVEAMSEAERLAFLNQAEGVEETYALMKSWAEISGELGAFESIGDFEIEKSGKTTTTNLYLNFENRQAVVTNVYNNRTMVNETLTIDLVYSTGEKMGKAALNTVMGMGTVFIMLIIICLIISCFKVVPGIEKRLAARKEKGQASAQKGGEVSAAVAAAGPETYGAGAVQRENLVDDLELVAVIAAAIAAATGQSEEDFVVRSIKRR